MIKRLTIVAALLGISSAPSIAQQKLPDAEQCFSAIPIGEFKRAIVFLQADADIAGLPYLPSAEVFAQAVAFKLREILGATSSQLPQADSVIMLSRLDGQMIVTAHRTRPLTWRIPSWYPKASDTVSRSSFALLAQGIKLTVADGDGIPLPENFKGDSVSFRLSFHYPFIDPHTGSNDYNNLGEGAAAFTLLLPWGKRVEQLRGPTIHYPESAKNLPHINTVRLAFTVDRTGHAIPASARDLWPDERPLPFGPQLLAYQSLLRAVKEGLRSAGYSPAQLGGCPVEETVTQRYDFRIEEPAGKPERH